jgi:RNA polymerase sigma-70 factor (ECF subfamily)
MWLSTLFSLINRTRQRFNRLSVLYWYNRLRMSDNAINDHALLADFVATQKPEAFAQLVTRYEPLVRAAANRQTGDPHLADDITQSTMMALMTKAHRIRRGQPIGPWLLRVAYFLGVDALRTDSARRRHEQLAAAYRTESHEPSAAVLEQPVDSVLDRALNSLREKDRTILVLRYLQGWSFEQISAELNLSMTATRQRLSRAIARLRALLEEQGVRRDEIFSALFPPLIAEINNYLAAPRRQPSLLHRFLRPWPIAAATLLTAVTGVVISHATSHSSSNPSRITAPPSANSQPPLNSRPNSTIP